MTREGEATGTPEGTPPAGEPDPKPTGTPPDGTGETTPPADPPEVDISVDAATSPETQGKAWENFRAKYPGMEEDAVKELFAEQWWEKAGYAKEQRERAERAEARLRELDDEKRAAKKDEPRAPHPHVEKIATKIKSLMEKDKGLYTKAEAAAKDYNTANAEALELKGMAKQAKATGDEDAADRLSARAAAASAVARSAQTDWEMVRSRREELAERVDDLVQEQQFVDTATRSQEEDAETDRRETQERIEAFPVWLDQQTVELVKDAGLSVDKHSMSRVMVHVRKSMHYDLAQPQNRDKNLKEMPLQQMVRNHIKEWAADHDVVARKNFTDKSKEKLKVSTPGKSESDPPKSGDKPPPPERPKGPVPVSYLARGGEAIPESFRRGREYLKKVGID